MRAGIGPRRWDRAGTAVTTVLFLLGGAAIFGVGHVVAAIEGQSSAGATVTASALGAGVIVITIYGVIGVQARLRRRRSLLLTQVLAEAGLTPTDRPAEEAPVQIGVVEEGSRLRVWVRFDPVRSPDPWTVIDGLRLTADELEQRFTTRTT